MGICDGAAYSDGAIEVGTAGRDGEICAEKNRSIASSGNTVTRPGTLIRASSPEGPERWQADGCSNFVPTVPSRNRHSDEPWSEVTGLLIAALFAGQHTSSITSTWSRAYLLCNLKYMSVVLDEQTELMQKHGNKVDYDILSEMEVLYRCIKEALRLHPPLIMLLRSSHNDFSVKTREGIEENISKGHIVATSPAFANRLPHIYKDPDTYNPDRFAPGRDEDKAAGAFSYISFGRGRHGCLGEPFTYLQIKALWSHLLRNFEMELISPFPEIDWNAMVIGVKGKVMVQYKRRELPLN